MRRGFTTTELIIAAVILAILAAIAIPIYRSYHHRGKRAEAVVMLKTISDSAVTYYGGVHLNKAGGVLQKTFPASAGPSPTQTPCSTGSPRYSASPGAWNTRGWRALRFSIGVPHYFQYQFVSSGFGIDAYFFAYAFGDLDCNGKLIEFKTSGRVDSGTGEVVRTPVKESERSKLNLLDSTSDG